MNHPAIPDNIDLPFPFSYMCLTCEKYPTHTIFTDGSGTVFSIEDHKQCGIMLKSNNLKDLYQEWNHIMLVKFTSNKHGHDEVLAFLGLNSETRCAIRADTVIIDAPPCEVKTSDISALGHSSYSQQVSHSQAEVYQAQDSARYVNSYYSMLNKKNKKKSRFSWRRVLTFIGIYFGYVIVAALVSKYLHPIFWYMFSVVTLGATLWVMGIKMVDYWLDYFWEDKTDAT